jgi:cell pole-organizing protein PopZ
MEDILASIRRILNEDEGTAPPPARRDPPTGETPEPLELTEEMMVTPPPQPPDPEPSMPPEPAPASSAEVPRGDRPEAAPPPMPAQMPSQTPPPGLIAPTVAAAAAASVSQLLRTVAAERSAAVSRSGPTIEDVVREELRPMLKEWLDKYLPPLVERLVRAEIERVVGRSLS